jgi:hypothetical protein
VVGVAQLIRAPGCGPGGRGFEPHHSPHMRAGLTACSFYIFSICIIKG